MISQEFQSILDELNFVRSEMQESIDDFCVGLLIQGYMKAVSDFAMWKDGKQKIGCMEKNPSEIQEKMMASLKEWQEYKKS